MNEDAGSPEDLATRSVAGQFSFTVKLDQSNDKSFNITGFIYAGDDLEAGNARIDLIDELVSRQITRSSIPVMEADLEQRIKGMDNYVDHLRGLQSQREEFSKNPKPTSLQKKQFAESSQMIDQSTTTLDAMRKDIESRRAAINAAKAKLA